MGEKIVNVEAHRRRAPRRKKEEEEEEEDILDKLGRDVNWC
jgi:hypothetical protein